MADISVYMDTCCFIDVVKKQKGLPTITNQDQDIWAAEQLLRAARNNDIRIYTSSLTMAELIGVRKSNNEAINMDAETQRLIGSILGSGRSGVIPVQPDYFVIKAAMDLAWTHGFSAVKPMDRMHLATAISVSCVEFVTTDNRLKSTIRTKMLGKLRLRICNTKDTTILPDQYRQMVLHAQ